MLTSLWLNVNDDFLDAGSTALWMKLPHLRTFDTGVSLVYGFRGDKIRAFSDILDGVLPKDCLVQGRDITHRISVEEERGKKFLVSDGGHRMQWAMFVDRR